jgi:tetratricopeptide (TPR) repeat protein
MIGMTGDDNINGRITRNKSELDESLKSARMSLKESEEKKDEGSIARDYSNIGQILKDKGELDEALRHAKKALEIQTKLNDEVGMAVSYNNIGQILQDKGELDEALSYAKMALKMDEELNDLFQVASDYFNLISLYYLIKNDREELVYLKKLKQLLDRVPSYSSMDYIIKRIKELEDKA